MFPFRRAPKRKPPPKPTWLVWALLVFGVYCFYMVSLPGSPASKSVQTAKNEVNSQIDLKEYKQKIFPENGAGIRISDVEEGKGDPAICGQEVKVAYQVYLAQGNKINDSATKEKPLTFTIGSGKTMPVFEKGVIGMKAGGKRSIIAPPLMSYGLEDYRRDDVPKGSSIRVEMELLSNGPKLPDLEVMPYRIAEVAVGGGPMLVCGEPAHIRIKVWDLTGKLLYTNKDEKEPFHFTPGRSEIMLGLDQGVIGMNEGATRLLIVPPSFQKTLTGKPPKYDFPLPKDQVVMIEATAIEPAAQ